MARRPAGETGKYRPSFLTTPPFPPSGEKACQKLYTQVLLGEDSIYNTIIFLRTARKKCEKNEKLNSEIWFRIFCFPTDLSKYAQEKGYAQVVISEGLVAEISY